MNNLQLNLHRDRGFTLVELIVSLGIFALVMLIASGAYFNLISLDRKARALNQLMSSLNFAVDTMARGIRTGTNYRCTNGTVDADGNASAGDCTAFSYTDAVLGTTVSYILKANGTIGRCEGAAPGGCTDTNASPLTDPAIQIQKLSFYVRGVGVAGAPPWAQQPHVTFVIRGRVPTPGYNAEFTIQQAATQRLIDF